MPPSVEIAFLEESSVSGALELIRRVLQPTSRSLPHITLRYSRRSKSEIWASSVAEPATVEIVLEGPVTFDNEHDERGVRTLVIACSSEMLELRSYKPDFPASIPHLTLYDGPPSREAAVVLRMLSSFPWSLRLVTALNLHRSSHDAIVASTSADRHGSLLTDAAERCRSAIFNELKLVGTRIDDLSPVEKLAVIESAARMIHSDPRAATFAAPAGDVVSYVEAAPAGQLAFWTPEEVWAISGEGPKHHRGELRKRGAFATPPELALDVAKALAGLADLAPDEMVDFGDPAVGNGVLFAAIREVLGPGRINSARVVEIDPVTARSSSQRWGRSGISVLEGDFLGASPELGAWSMVLANPPYRRSQDISQDLSSLRAAFTTRLGISISARSDLYVYFLLQADEWLRHGGIAAWIIPSEFQVTSYGAAVRRYLTTSVELLRIHTYATDDPLFDKALTSTSVIIFRKATPSASRQLQVSLGGTLDAPAQTATVGLQELQAAARWSFAALANEAPKRSSRRYSRLGEFFTFRRGIATGANSYFVLDDLQLVSLKVRRDWVRPLVPRTRDLPDGKIGSDVEGNPVPRSGRWLIDTSCSVQEIRQESPEFADYLELVSAAVGDRHLVARRSYPFKQEAREAAPVLFVYMAKRNRVATRFMRNDSRAIHLNNLIGMYPRPALTAEFGTMDNAMSALWSVGPDALEAAGRSYGNGLLKLEPKELSEVQIRRPS